MTRIEDICKEVIENEKKGRELVFEVINVNDIDHKNMYPSNQVVMRWFGSFRKNGESFPNTNKRRSLLEKQPPFFRNNPDMLYKFNRYARLHLKDLSGELRQS